MVSWSIELPPIFSAEMFTAEHQRLYKGLYSRSYFGSVHNYYLSKAPTRSVGGRERNANFIVFGKGRIRTYILGDTVIPTLCLFGYIFHIWWKKKDSNFRPPTYQIGTLTSWVILPYFTLTKIFAGTWTRNIKAQSKFAFVHGVAISPQMLYGRAIQWKRRVAEVLALQFVAKYSSNDVLIDCMMLRCWWRIQDSNPWCLGENQVWWPLHQYAIW